METEPQTKKQVEGLYDNLGRYAVVAKAVGASKVLGRLVHQVEIGEGHARDYILNTMSGALTQFQMASKRVHELSDQCGLPLRVSQVMDTHSRSVKANYRFLAEKLSGGQR